MPKCDDPGVEMGVIDHAESEFEITEQFPACGGGGGGVGVWGGAAPPGGESAIWSPG